MEKNKFDTDAGSDDKSAMYSVNNSSPKPQQPTEENGLLITDNLIELSEKTTLQTESLSIQNIKPDKLTEPEIERKSGTEARAKVNSVSSTSDSLWTSEASVSYDKNISEEKNDISKSPAYSNDTSHSNTESNNKKTEFEITAHTENSDANKNDDFSISQTSSAHAVRSDDSDNIISKCAGDDESNKVTKNILDPNQKENTSVLIIAPEEINLNPNNSNCNIYKAGLDEKNNQENHNGIIELAVNDIPSVQFFESQQTNILTESNKETVKENQGQNTTWSKENLTADQSKDLSNVLDPDNSDINTTNKSDSNTENTEEHNDKTKDTKLHLDMGKSESKDIITTLNTTLMAEAENADIRDQKDMPELKSVDEVSSSAKQVSSALEISKVATDGNLGKDNDEKQKKNEKEQADNKEQITLVDNKEQTSTKNIIKTNKSSSEGKPVARSKPQRDRKTNTVRDGAFRTTGRKSSTPRNINTKRDDQKTLASKDMRKTTPARKIGIDHSREKLGQNAVVKDTKFQKSSSTDKSTPLTGRISDDSKNRETDEKQDSEKKPLSENKNKAEAEIPSSTKEKDAEQNKYDIKKNKDESSHPNTSLSVIDENEEIKKPQKVKWNEKVIIQTKNNEKKQVPNGNVVTKENQENDKLQKAESALDGKANNVIEKNQTVVTIEEGSAHEKDGEKFNPKAIFAKAVWNKAGKDKPGSVAMNGPTKTLSKSSLAVRSGSTVEEKEEKLSVESRRDSTKLSLDSVSHKSIDYRNATTIINPIPEEKPRSLLNSNDSWIRSAIPYQPLSLSILCLFLNVILPGSGTIVSGFSILCCGKTRVTSKDDHVPITVCLNIWVGVAQFFTITFCLVGWFWSIAWGIKMIILSVEYRRELKAKREMELQAMALSAFGSPSRVRQLFHT